MKLNSLLGGKDFHNSYQQVRLFTTFGPWFGLGGHEDIDTTITPYEVISSVFTVAKSLKRRSMPCFSGEIQFVKNFEDLKMIEKPVCTPEQSVLQLSR